MILVCVVVHVIEMMMYLIRYSKHATNNSCTMYTNTHTHMHIYTHDIHMYTTNSLCFDASTNIMMLMGELSIKCCHKYYHNMHVNMQVVTVFIYRDYDT